MCFTSTSQPLLLVSKSGQLLELGFSVEVADDITAPQRSSTRTVYRSKWALFEKWYRRNLVDFSTPPVKQSQIFSFTCTKTLTGAPRPLMVTGLPLLRLWAQRPSTLHIMQTFIGYSPVSTRIAQKFQKSP